MAVKERIVIVDEDVFGRLTVDREPAPLLQLMPVFEPIGAGRGEWERAREAEVQYFPPRAARAA
jgi:hypothetical protein